MLLGGPPDGQRGGGAVSTVEKRRACWQGAEEISGESTKHPGWLVGLLSCSYWYQSVLNLCLF